MEIPTEHGTEWTGGRAAIAGFLYQILCSLERMTRIAFANVNRSDNTVHAATLILEPDAGGDLSSLDPGGRIVEQFKHRSTTRPWSAREIIEDVLPDLYRAVDIGSRVERMRYRFVTDGRCPVRGFRAFLGLLRDKTAPDNPKAVFDHSQLRYRLGSHSLTAREFFRQIANKLDPKGVDSTKVWNLLAHLDIEDGLDEAAIIEKVDAVLADLVEVREQIPNKRDELVGLLFKLACRSRPTTVNEILIEVHLDPRRLLHIRRLPALLARCVRDDARALDYDAGADVRTSIALPQDKPIILLTGESGQGKTWCLSRLAIDLAAANECIVLLRARGGLQRIEQQIIERVWHSGGFDMPLPLDRVADRLAPKLRREGGFWLTVCIDDIQDRQLVEDLLDPRWQRLGIRLVLSAQPRISHALSRQGAERVASLEVKDFTPSELRALLIRHHKNWAALPDDMLALLRRPILASFYCRLDERSDWVPANEYALMERYWRWVTHEAREQDDHRGDAETAKALAGTLLGTEPRYPWPTSMARSHGLSEEARLRLTSVGLLRDEGEDGIGAGHDRLLNWMVADWLSDQVRLGMMSLTEIREVFRRMTGADAEWTRDLVGTRLGYVPMDVLWLLSAAAPADELSLLVRDLALHPLSRYGHEGLFRDLLPTLGSRILPVLIAMFRPPHSEDDHWWLPTNVAHVIAAVGKHEPDATRGAIRQLLSSDLPLAVEAGAVAIASVPAPDLLERLWQLHLENVNTLDAASDNRRLEALRRNAATFDALVSSAQLAPEWIDHKLQTVGPSGRADQLVYILLRLTRAAGREIWRRRKVTLFENVQKNRGCLAQAIQAFKDREEINWLEDWKSAANDGFDVVLRFDALARLAPERALTALSTLTSPQIKVTSDWWLPIVIHRQGNHARQALRQIHDSSDWKHQRDLAIIYRNHEHLLDAPTLDTIVNTLEQRLAAADADDTWKPTGEGHLLNLIAGVRRPDLLAVLRRRRGSRFEKLLARRAIRRPGRQGLDVDSDGDEYRRILLAIGGEGVSRLVESELARATEFARIDGIKASVLCPTEAIRGRLRAMAASSKAADREYYDLALALACLDENEALATMVCAGANVSYTVLDIRRHKPPLPDSIVKHAENDVRSGDDQRRQGAILVLALSNRMDVQPTLLHVLETFEPTSPEVRLSIVALDALGLYAPEILPRVSAVLRVEDSRKIACNYLLRRSDATGRALLVDYLSSHPLDRLTSVDNQLAFHLLHYPDSAPGARDFLRRILGRGFGTMIRGDILRALTHAGDRSARDQLYEVAFQVSKSGSGGWHAAVQSLAELDPDAAFAAAQRRLERDASPDVVDLLMLIDASQGTDILLQHITQEFQPTIRFAIARAFRWHADRSGLETRLSAMTRHTDPRQREAAAELCGWQPPAFLANHIVELVDDDVKEVEQAALNALRRQQNQRWIGELLDNIAAAEGANRWSLLFATIDFGDPELLNYPNDPLCIWPVLKQFPIEYTIIAEERLSKRREEVKRSNENADRRHRP